MELLSLGTKVLRDESSIIRLCDLVVYWSQYCKSSVTVNRTGPHRARTGPEMIRFD